MISTLGTEGFFTWEAIATFAGACSATAIITQGLKLLTDKLPMHVPPRLISYIIAVLLLCAATFFTGSSSVESYILCFVNGCAVALASNGTYELASDITRQLKGDKNEDNT